MNTQPQEKTFISPFSLDAQYSLKKSSGDKKGIAEIQGILSTQNEDSQGETVFIAGMDITPLNTGMAQINWWHLGRQNPAMVIGLVDWAKKIRNNTAIAFRGHLLDTESGRAAKELIEAMEAEGKRIGVSVEGSTIVKQGSKVYRSIARGCALATDQINKDCTAALIKAVQDFSVLETLNPLDVQKAIAVEGDSTFGTSPLITSNLGLISLEEAIDKLQSEYPDINREFIKDLLIKIIKENG